MSGVAVAVLCLNGKLNSLVDIINSYNRKNGHHKLFLYEIVVKVGLADDAAHVRTNLNAYHLKNNRRVSAHALTADALDGLARLVGLLFKNRAAVLRDILIPL